MGPDIHILHILRCQRFPDVIFNIGSSNPGIDRKDVLLYIHIRLPDFVQVTDAANLCKRWIEVTSRG